MTTFKPCDPLISFVSETPRLCWVASKGPQSHSEGKVTYEFQGLTQVFVSYSEDERDRGIGMWISGRRLQHRTPELVAVCEQWTEEYRELQGRLRRLASGEVTE